jgi:hypothetical protein
MPLVPMVLPMSSVLVMVALQLPLVCSSGTGHVSASDLDRNHSQAAEEALWRARGDFETEKAAWGQECVEVRRRLVAAEL